jgi:hypothetical protein
VTTLLPAPLGDDDDIIGSMIHGISTDSTDANENSFDFIRHNREEGSNESNRTDLPFWSETGHSRDEHEYKRPELSRRLSIEWWQSGLFHEGEEAEDE